MTIREAIRRHLHGRPFQKKYTRDTADYMTRLADFLAHRRIRHIEDIAARDIDDFAAHVSKMRCRNGLREGEIISRRTQICILGRIRSIFRDLERAGMIPWDPTDHIDLPKLPPKLPRRIPGPGEIARLIAAVPDAPDPPTKTRPPNKYDRAARRAGRVRLDDLRRAAVMRDRVVLELLYGSGLRCAELIGLDLYDADLTRRTARVRGKGGRDRVVPITRAAARALARFIADGRSKIWRPKMGDALIVTFERRIGRTEIQRAITRACVRAGIPHIHPHLLRHACATHMMNHGADIRYVQEMLGHKRLQATQIYTHLAPMDLIDAHARFHPRSRRRRIPRIAA